MRKLAHCEYPKVISLTIRINFNCEMSSSAQSPGVCPCLIQLFEYWIS
jgi:hypothetical protein